MRPTLESSINKLAQAEADWKAVSSLTASLTPIFVALGITLVVLLPLRAAIESNSVGPRNTAPPSQSKVTAPVTSPVQSQNNNATLLSPAEQKVIESKKFYEQGVAHTKAGEYEEAVKAYQRAISLKGDYIEAHHELGYALYKVKKYEESITASKQAIVLNPKNADTYHNLGLAYSILGKWQEAIKAFQQAISIKPNYPVAYYDLGLAYKNALENESAMASFQEAIRLKRDYANAHYELGLLYLDTGNQTAAMNEYTILTAIDIKLANKLFTAITK
jgi:tetratricopeptide (TPR) repeat protein